MEQIFGLDVRFHRKFEAELSIDPLESHRGEPIDRRQDVGARQEPLLFLSIHLDDAKRQQHSILAVYLLSCLCCAVAHPRQLCR